MGVDISGTTGAAVPGWESGKALGELRVHLSIVAFGSGDDRRRKGGMGWLVDHWA